MDIFGSNRGIMNNIEEQERGLLHAHCMVWIVERAQIQEMDKIISPALQIEYDNFWPFIRDKNEIA